MKQFTITFLLLMFSQFVLSDSIEYVTKIDNKEYRFGDVKIIKTRDSSKSKKSTDWSIEIYNKNELRALYRGVSFSHIISNKSNTVFVGISNSGYPGTAVIVFDSDGNLRLERKHKEDLFEYCEWSISVIREWYKKDMPNLRIESDKYGREVVKVSGCKGGEIDVLSNL